MAWTDTALTIPTNHTFASGLTGWTEGNTQGDWAADTTAYDADSKSVKVQCVNVPGWHCETTLTSAATALLAGSTRKLIIRYYINTSATPAKIDVQIRALDAADDSLLAHTHWATLTGVTWTPLAVTFTVPAGGSVKAQIYVETSETGASVEYPVTFDCCEFWEAGATWSPETPPTTTWTVS